jgi:hypothetical protein
VKIPKSKIMNKNFEELFVNNKIEQIFKELLNHKNLNDNELYDELLLIKNRYEANEKDHFIGTISKMDYDVIRNQIVQALLNLTQKIISFNFENNKSYQLKQTLNRENELDLADQQITNHVFIGSIENTPSIEIDLCFLNSGEVYRCKVPSNILTSTLINHISERFNFNLIDSKEYFIEYFLFDLDKNKRIEPSLTLEQSGYSGSSIFNFNFVAKKRAPRIGIRFSGAKKCFPASIKVILSDRNEKNIDKIVCGDEISSYNFLEKKISHSTVNRVITGKVGSLIIINDIIFGSSGQTIFTKRGLLKFEELKIGDCIFQYPYLNTYPINKLNIILKRCRIYNIIAKPFNNFFANGFLVEDQIGLSKLDSYYQTESNLFCQ